jgi:hypothetical protein
VRTHPADVLALALPEAEFIAPLPIDVATEPQLILDTPLRVRYKGVECAVDIEAEATPRGDIGRHLRDYAVRAGIVTGLSVISVVLWLTPDGLPPPSPSEERVADLLLGTWRFFGIEVYRLPAQALLDRGLAGLLPPVPFTPEGGDPAVVERAAAEIKQRAAPDNV